ncbi:hypothetical protein [Maridesulfovibrio bastinii]|uniref:hypothetical protein n=1 Tax=Maridesulfovibrio bastinii TaxID=47157 RepID=UPI00041CF965|nr:hypothetical protein [Maridesulfovibrio bastinii]
MSEPVFDSRLSKEIADAVAAGISKGVACALENGACSCRLDGEAAREVGHFMGMVRDIGGGEHSKGIERMREHHKAVGAMLEGRRVFWLMFFKIMATAGIGFVGMACWDYFNRMGR